MPTSEIEKLESCDQGLESCDQLDQSGSLRSARERDSRRSFHAPRSSSNPPVERTEPNKENAAHFIGGRDRSNTISSNPNPQEKWGEFFKRVRQGKQLNGSGEQALNVFLNPQRFA